MDLEMKLSGYFFKIHTAEAPTRAGGLSAQLTEGGYACPLCTAL